MWINPLEKKDIFLATNDQSDNLCSVIVSLFQDFDNAFLSDPSGLPLIKRIGYQIDHIPKALIPNRPAYRSYPKKIRKIRRQVEESLTKGYIRESMSPWVILIPLVPKKDG